MLVGSWWYDKAGLRWDVTSLMIRRERSYGDEQNREQAAEGREIRPRAGEKGEGNVMEGHPKTRKKRRVTRQYHAEHHPNVFGPSPRLVKGVVTRNRFVGDRCEDYSSKLYHETFNLAGLGEYFIDSESSSSSMPENPPLTSARGAFLFSWGSFKKNKSKAKTQPESWLRPVVGTFTAEGDGIDTHDPFYRKREGEAWW